VLFLGDDWAEAHHDIELQDEHGRVLARRRLPEGVGGLAQLHALLGAHLPTVEVHISNIYKRENFRHQSLTAPACVAVITGLGLEGYHAAIRFLLKS